MSRAPLRLVVPATVAAVFLVVPVIGLLVDTPWSRFWTVVTGAEALDALRLSVVTALLSTLLCVVLGLPLAWVLARLEFPGRRLLRGLVTVPLVLPPVVGGVALLSALGRNGLLGRPLDDVLGVTLPYTTAAVVVAHTFVSMPFFVISAEGALRAVPSRMETASATLGAGPWLTFRRVSLPLALPGVAAGAVLSFARSLGEFGATITFAGNYPGTTRTMPSEVYTRLQDDRDVAVALSVVLLVVSVAVLVSLRERWLGGLGAA
ncbi:molybdate ABC transporter permease [Marmoricola endophyticus]|uniref:Molybdenum transport system permease n=1 Tax=Marmoricola endophyticus TaxID=2040280 RepID=A0A917BPX3_9ACTN|nr:ABC transporter permease [Marmoricola endophyticus]GGF54331.1 molybdate ABC transporter permease [Marmoricola endophyticus]